MQIFLTFSDTAKFADVARNLVMGRGYGGNFSFFDAKTFGNLAKALFPSPGVLPVAPFSIAAFFKIFGVNDFAVIATSFFYFLLTLVFVFLLAKKLFGKNLVAALSTLAIGFNYDLTHYAISGASESLFILEIIAGAYFISLKKKWINALAAVFLVLLYFTRPLAFIYIAGLILFWLFINLKTKKAVIYFTGILVAGLLVDHFVLVPLSGKYFLYSITGRGINSALAQAVSTSPSDYLRGVVGISSSGRIVQVAKNVFYNLYNFYKLLPQIINPYLFALFIMGLFIKAKDRMGSSFKVASVFMVVVTFLVTAASIPFFRYIHPVIPLIYIVAVGTLVGIISKFECRNIKQILDSKFKVTKQSFTVFATAFLIIVFGVGQTVGIIFLDSRFERNTHNVGKPPVYVRLSEILKDNTSANQLVVTNLDTWGSWYGERKTVWFPLEPDQLIFPEGQENQFDAIYLTSYLMDDENYYMGEEWREIFLNPESHANGFIAENYELKKIIEISSEDVYEKQDARAVLLVKKSN